MGELVRSTQVPNVLPTRLNKRELDIRSGYGVTVSLYWLIKTNSLELIYTDEQEPHQDFRTIVPNDKGLEAIKFPNRFRPEN